MRQRSGCSFTIRQCHFWFLPVLSYAPRTDADPGPTSGRLRFPALSRALEVPPRLFELDRTTSFLSHEVKARPAWNLPLGATAPYPNSFSFPDSSAIRCVSPSSSQAQPTLGLQQQRMLFQKAEKPESTEGIKHLLPPT